MDITEKSSSPAILQVKQASLDKTKRSTFFGFFLSDENKLVNLERTEMDITDSRRRDPGHEVKSRSTGSISEMDSEDTVINEANPPKKKKASSCVPLAPLGGLALMLIQKILMAIFYKPSTLHIDKKMKILSTVSMAISIFFAFLYMIGIISYVKRALTPTKMLIALLTLDNLITSCFLIFPIVMVMKMDNDEIDERNISKSSTVLLFTYLAVFSVMNVCVCFTLLRHIRFFPRPRPLKREESVVSKIEAPNSK